jgi:PAS domain S-box-containing protein
VRFLWRTDAEDRFMDVTPPLAEAVGANSADLLGRTVQQVAESLQLDPQGELAKAFAKRETWSAIEVKWPVAGTQGKVPVVLGALPCFDRDKRFEGYHGFGAIYADRIAQSHDAGVLAAPAAEPELAANTKADAATDAVLPPSYGGENVVLLRPLGTVSGAIAKNSAADISAEPIFPIASEAPDMPESASPDGSLTDLSSAEQNAFHEIARALTSDEHLAPRHEEPDALAAAFAVETPAPEPKDKPSDFVQEPAKAAEPLSEMEQLARNATAVFTTLNAGLLVSRNEELVFANHFLLNLLGYENLSALHAAGGLTHLLQQPATERSAKIDVATHDGQKVPMIVREQCVEWDHLPATLLILQPTEASEIHASADARFSQYEAESRELNAILDTATDGVAVLDSAGRILTLNRSGEALFGYDQNEVVGQPFSTLFDAQSRAIAEDYLEGLKTNAVKSLLNDGREIVGRARQGGSIPIFITLGRVSSSHAEEKDLKFCALLRDMTHWKKVEQELEEARQGAERASALKSDFLAKVSHEIRTPLNAILGFAEVIMDERFGPIGNERYKDYLKDIHMSGAHVMSLVNDLLDLSKIEAGKLELNFNAVDANRIISECVALMQPQANRERVIMRMSLATNLPPISADERSLRQIILNLLSNAVKFNEPGGQVIVATALSDAGHAIIRIRDTGIGMSEKDIETALEPFRQVATARQTGGTGLGLPLTKALVEANHAYFSIKSKKQEGTLVEVTFPVMRVSA